MMAAAHPHWRAWRRKMVAEGLTRTTPRMRAGADGNIGKGGARTTGDAAAVHHIEKYRYIVKPPCEPARARAFMRASGVVDGQLILRAHGGAIVMEAIVGLVVVGPSSASLPARAKTSSSP